LPITLAQGRCGGLQRVAHDQYTAGTESSLEAVKQDRLGRRRHMGHGNGRDGSLGFSALYRDVMAIPWAPPCPGRSGWSPSLRAHHLISVSAHVVMLIRGVPGRCKSRGEGVAAGGGAGERAAGTGATCRLFFLSTHRSQNRGAVLAGCLPHSYLRRCLALGG
jgi:hypothetical protein